MEHVWFIAVFLIALAGTVIATPFSRWLARLTDAIDYPDGRRVNTQPVPRLGGVALCIGIVVALAAVMIANWADPTLIQVRGLNQDINYGGVAAAALIIFVTGLIDDLFQIKPLLKLAGQIIAACIAAASGVLWGHLLNPFGSELLDLGVWAYPLTVFYLVAFANIINLIDGLDGLASGIVAICATTLFILSLDRGGTDAALAAAALVGACLGFLFFNFNPAKVFLGDSGSLLLGFCLGLISLFGVARTSTLISLLIPVVAAGIPVIDTFTSIVRRLRSGKSIAGADTEHVHHRFINLGFSQRTTVLIIYGMSALLSVLAILISQELAPLRYIALAALVVVVALFVWRLGLMSSVLTHHYEKRHPHEKPPKDGE